MTKAPLDFAFSPCPNDTFSFHALVAGLVAPDVAVRPVLLDIEELNRRAIAGEFPISKASFGVLPKLEGRYRLLSSGSALGFGCGPLVVAREPMTLKDAARRRIAIPGRDTTAFLLLRLAAGEPPHAVEMRYDRILGAVERGEADAGLIIHESRFTYAEHGLTQIADLGAWWEGETNLPVPLGAIVAREDLGAPAIARIEAAIRESVAFARAHPAASRAYVRENAQELSDDVCQRHIDLYVNEYSVDLGDLGRRAVASLVKRADPRR